MLKQDYTYRVHRTGETVLDGVQALEGVVEHPHNLHPGQHEVVEVALTELAHLPSARVLWDHRLVALDQDGDGVGATFAIPAGEQIHLAAG